MKKRILSMLLVIVMVLSLVPVTALAEGDWRIVSSKEAGGYLFTNGETITLSLKDNEGNPITSGVTWSTDAPLSGTDSGSGTYEITASGPDVEGLATVTAGYDGVEKTVNIMVFRTPDTLTIVKEGGTPAPTTMEKGEACQLSFSVSPRVTYVFPKWSVTGDTNVLQVGEDGLVKAVGYGTATVQLMMNGKTATQKITVPDPIPGEITIVPSADTVRKDETVTLSVSMAGRDDLKGDSYTWEVDKQNSTGDVTFAPSSSDNTCLVTGTTAGSVKIKVTRSMNSQAYAGSITLNVESNGITIQTAGDKTSILVGEELAFTAVDAKGNALEGVTWTSGTPTAADFDPARPNVLIGAKAGETTKIIASKAGYANAELEISVGENGISIVRADDSEKTPLTELTIAKGSSVDLKAVDKNGKDLTGVTWGVTKDEDKAFADVSNGKLEGKGVTAEGKTVEIYAEKNGYKQTLDVTVINMTGVSLKPGIETPVVVRIGAPVELDGILKYEPPIATHENVKWESGRPEILTIENGKLIAHAVSDEVTVKGSTFENVELITFKVTTTAEKGIELDPNMPTELLCGQQMLLKASVKDAAGKEVENTAIKWELVTPKANDAVTLDGNKLVALPDLKNPYDIEIKASAVNAEGNAIEGVAPVTFTVTIIPQAHQVLLTLDGENINGKTIKLNVNDPADAAGVEVIAKINPNTADQGVFWSIKGDSTICTYDPNDFQEGPPAVPASVVVKPIGANKTGTITVTATARTNEDIKAQFTVEFTKLPTSLEILDLEEGHDKNFRRGGDNLTLRTSLEKDNTLTNRRVKWEVTGVAGATIENGVLNTPAVATRTEITVTATAEATGVQDIKYITLCPSVASIAITKDDGSKVPGVVDFNDGSIQLKKTVNPNGDYIDAFEWTPSNPNVATVDQNGLVTFVDAGTVRITCAALDGSNVKAHVNLTIEKRANTVLITGANELVSGKSTALTATVYVDDTYTEKAANQDVIWSVVDENGKATTAASISATGRLGAKTVSRGVVVTVIARSVENENAYDEFPVTIKPKKAKTLVPYFENESEFIDDVLYLKPGEEDQYISGLWYDSAADDYTDAEDCTFFSSKSSVATIDSDGTLKTYKKGSTTITVRATDPDTGNVYTTKFTVKVLNTVDHVTIKSSKGTELRSGKSLNLAATVWSNAAGTVKADNQAVTWEIFEMDEKGTFVATKAASISSRGRVTANAVNENKTVFVVATSKENDGLSDVIELTIRPKSVYTVMLYKNVDDKGNPVIPTEPIVLEMGTPGAYITGLYVDVYVSRDGEEGHLYSGIPPYSWTSSNKKAVGVGDYGLVYVGNGTAKISAKVKDGKTYTSNTVTVSLVNPVTSVTVQKKYSGQELYSGKTLLMKATVNKDATNKAVKWSFANEEDYLFASINENTGLIRAKKGLKAQVDVTVLATATDGSGKVSDPVTVTIYPMATKVEIDGVGERKTMVLKTRDTLTATVTPGEANQDVKWSSNRSSIVSVDKDGNIEAKRRGTATIKATAADGSGVYATVKITVVNP